MSRNLRRRSSTVLAGAKKANRSGNETIFESFIVIGRHVNDKEHDILFEYPTKSLEKLGSGKDIIQFCVPDNFNKEPVEVTSLDHLNELLFSQDSVQTTRSNTNSFIFLLNVGSNLLYGITVLTPDIINTVPSFCENKFKNEEESEEENDVNEEYLTDQRCYCLLTKYPFFETHFTVLHNLLAMERLFNLQTLATITSVKEFVESKNNELVLNKPIKEAPLLNPRVKILLGEVEEIKPEELKPETWESRGSGGMELLCIYYNETIPKENKQWVRQISCKNYSTVDLFIPPISELQLISSFCCPVLFEKFSLSNILLYYTACLLEQQIIVVSKDPGLLSAIVLSVITLIYPMVWQGPLITVTPESLMECLQAPFPTIVGMRELPDDRTGWLDPFIIDADTGEITLPKLKLEKLPQQKYLLSNIKESFQRFKSGQDQNASKEEGLNLVDTVIEFINSYTSWLIEDNIIKTIANECNCNVVDVLLDDLPKNSTNFWKQLITTQQFAVHAEKMRNLVNEHHDDMNEVLKKLDTLLSEVEKEKISSKKIIEREKKHLADCEERIKTLQQAKESLFGELNKQKTSCPPTKPKKPSKHRRSKSWFHGQFVSAQNKVSNNNSNLKNISTESIAINNNNNNNNNSSSLSPKSNVTFLSSKQKSFLISKSISK